jgi:serine/threonine protein kinase
MKYNIPVKKSLNKVGVRLVDNCWMKFVVVMLCRSVGVLLYVLLTGCSPFGGDTKQETFCNISQCKLDFPEDLFEDVSENAKDLMRKLMVKEPRYCYYVDIYMSDVYLCVGYKL